MRDMIKIYAQPAFLICAAVLAIAGSCMSWTIRRFNIYLKKEPVPLKKSLDLLDEKAFATYKVVRKEKIENEEVVKSLGTKDYLQWILEDTVVSADSAVRYCLLFITYYELPDNVPHVPEECYTGSGYQRVASDNATFEIKRLNNGGKEDQPNSYRQPLAGTRSQKVSKKAIRTQKIPGKYVVFAIPKSKHWQQGTEFPVLYLFRVNQEYAGSRGEARIILNKNLFGKYSYFCKIECKFFNNSFGTVIYPGQKEAITANQKLLSVILPILEREHWPDLKREN